MAKRNSLTKNTLLYIIGNFGSKVLNFILVPLYTYYITTEEMGIYDIYYTTATLLIPVITLSISEASYRWLLDEKSKIEDVISITMRILVMGLGFFTIIYWSAFAIFRFEYSVFRYFIVIFSGFYGSLSNIVRGLKKNTIYAVLGVTQTFLVLGFNVILLVILKLGVYGLLGSQVLAYGILSILILFILVKGMGIKLQIKKKDSELQKDMLKYSWPLIPNSINWWITNLSDRYMIRWIIGASSNGIYSISCKFPGVIDTFVGLFSMAWQEDAICSYEGGIDKEYFSKTYEKYYTFLLTTITCAMPATYYFIIFFMESMYQSAWKYAPILYVGTVFHAMANYLSVGYNIKKDTKWVTITSLAAAATNIIINLIFMKRYGLQVASISTMFSYFVVFLIRYLTTRDVFQLRINYVRVLLLFVYTFMMAFCLFLESHIINILAFVCSVIVFLIVNKEFLKNMLGKLRLKK